MSNPPRYLPAAVPAECAQGRVDDSGTDSRNLLGGEPVAASVLREKKATAALTIQQIEDTISPLDPTPVPPSSLG